MVLFENIVLNQPVEVLMKEGQIERGTVRYKGKVVGREGEWVGLEMDSAVGDSTGLVRGQRYFQAKPDHGLFTVASRVRKIKTTSRRLFDAYRKSSEEPWDQGLAGYEKPAARPNARDRTPIASVDVEFVERAKSGRLSQSASDPFAERPKSYNLRHSIGGTRRAATMTQERAADALPTQTRTFRRSTPVHAEFPVHKSFNPQPSVPKIHMPHAFLSNLVKQGFKDNHYTRYMTVHNGRDSIKASQWNDISA